MAEDPNREIRTMVLLALPYPPLPVLAARIELDDERLHEDGVTTSHTLIAMGLNDAMARKDTKANGERKERQMGVFRQFLHAMGTEGFFCDVERLYLLFCRFSLDHIATYFPVGHRLDIRFQPLSYAVRGDKVHAKMAEYLAAQSLLFEDPVPVPREHYLGLEFPQMLTAVRDRLGHAMTADERAYAESLESRDDSESVRDESEVIRDISESVRDEE
jgi:hypothetical protein